MDQQELSRLQATFSNLSPFKVDMLWQTLVPVRRPDESRESALFRMALASNQARSVIFSS